MSTGFRNQYDAAVNREGELFTYDADMEWDMNTPLVPPYPGQPCDRRSGLWLAYGFREIHGFLQRYLWNGRRCGTGITHRRKLRVRGQVSRQIPKRILRKRLVLRKALCRSSQAPRIILRGCRRRVRKRPTLSPDRSISQPQGRSDVHCGSRKERSNPEYPA